MFTNGPEDVSGDQFLSITGFQGNSWIISIYRILLLSDFDTLYGKLELNGKVIPAELKEFFNLKEISHLPPGALILNLRMEGIHS